LILKYYLWITGLEDHEAEYVNMEIWRSIKGTGRPHFVYKMCCLHRLFTSGDKVTVSFACNIKINGNISVVLEGELPDTGRSRGEEEAGYVTRAAQGPNVILTRAAQIPSALKTRYFSCCYTQIHFFKPNNTTDKALFARKVFLLLY
jgi:hypothetical protein